jgi:peptidoglycan/xylan/chitin deacetylase (PgdA/CDA1 family)
MPPAAALARPIRSLARTLTSPLGTVRRVVTGAPEMVLTYDDGPEPVGTPAVLSALSAFDATATFFVLVRRVRLYPGLLHEVMAAGHEIALHGHDHTRLTTLSPKQVYARTRDAKAELEDRAGREVRWFRAPYGALLPAHWLAVRRAGLEPVAWGPTVGDWRPLPEEELAAEGLSGAGAGEIVLCHDSFAGPDDCGDDGPVPDIDRGRLTKLLLTGLRERGLRGVSLGHALGSGKVARWAWFKR